MSHTSQATFYIFEQCTFLKSQRLDTIEYVLLPQNGMNNQVELQHRPQAGSLSGWNPVSCSVSWCVRFCAAAKSTMLKVVDWGGVVLKESQGQIGNLGRLVLVLLLILLLCRFIQLQPVRPVTQFSINGRPNQRGKTPINLQKLDKVFLEYLKKTDSTVHLLQTDYLI